MDSQGGVILSGSGRSFAIWFRRSSGSVLIVPQRNLWKANRWHCRQSRFGRCSGDAATTGLCAIHTMAGASRAVVRIRPPLA